jgi:hypothetical protein
VDVTKEEIMFSHRTFLQLTVSVPFLGGLLGLRPSTPAPEAEAVGLITTSAQRRFYASHRARKAYIGARVSMKTTTGSCDLLRNSLPGRDYLVIAPNYPMLTNSTQRRFLEVADGMNQYRPELYSKSQQRATLRNGAAVWFVSAENLERIARMRPEGIWIDEASSVSPEAFRAIAERLPRWMTLTFTPGGKRERIGSFFICHWTGRLGWDWFCVRARTSDNPFLDRKYLERLRKAPLARPTDSLSVCSITTKTQ